MVIEGDIQHNGTKGTKKCLIPVGRYNDSVSSPDEVPPAPPAPEPARRAIVRLPAVGLGLGAFGIFAGVLLQKEKIGGPSGSLLALVSAILGTGFLLRLLIGRSSPAAVPPAGPEARQRRRDLRNYGVSLLACGLGVVAGLLIQRTGWGNSFGGVFAAASGAMGVFCAGALGWAALKK
jgi:hypothetical protein